MQKFSDFYSSCLSNEGSLSGFCTVQWLNVPCSDILEEYAASIYKVTVLV